MSSSLDASMESGRPIADVRAKEVDLNATYRFRFASERWLTGVGTAVQGALMVITGAFLALQISVTPKLAVQLGIVGALLAVAGIGFLIQAFGDLFGHIAIDRNAINGRVGLSSFSIPLTKVKRWSMNEESIKIPELPCVQIWTTDSEHPREIPGGTLSKTDHFRVRHLLFVFLDNKDLHGRSSKA